MIIEQTLQEYTQEALVFSLDTKASFVRTDNIAYMLGCVPYNINWHYKLNLIKMKAALFIYFFKSGSILIEEMTFEDEYRPKRNYELIELKTFNTKLIIDTLYKIEDKFSQELPQDLWDLIS